jgi:hypothetical protein
LLYGRSPHAYRILFEIRDEEQAVYVLRILHGARDYWRPGAPPDAETDEDFRNNALGLPPPTQKAGAHSICRGAQEPWSGAAFT